jgi:hypothetical protein
MSLFIGPRWLRFRVGRRGRTRVSLGPRIFRLHAGGGYRPGVSTGAGCLTWFIPVRRRRRR